MKDIKNIKVLHFYKEAYPTSYGGIAFFIHNLCKKGKSFGIKNTSLAFKKTNKNNIINKSFEYESYEIKEDFTIFSTTFSLKGIFKFRELAKNSDIIHFHYPYPFADILYFLFAKNKKSVVTYHSDIVRQKKLLFFYKIIRDLFLNSVDHIVATSNNYFVSSKTLQKFNNKVSIIPIGIDINSYPIISKKIQLKFKKYLPKNFFIFVGNFRYYKGLDIALNAVKGTNLNLVLVGIGQVKNKIIKKVREEKITNVIFIDSVSEEEKIALLDLAYAFIFPSYLRSEAFGISLLEAAAMGKPLISCEINTGTSYINNNGLTGLVIKPKDKNSLKKAMNFLNSNKLIAKKMGREAKKRAIDLFNEDKTIQEYKKIYISLLNK